MQGLAKVERHISRMQLRSGKKENGKKKKNKNYFLLKRNLSSSSLLSLSSCFSMNLLCLLGFGSFSAALLLLLVALVIVLFPLDVFTEAVRVVLLPPDIVCDDDCEASL